MKPSKRISAKILQQSGQAMLEYLLVIFVIVSIFLGIMLEVSRGTSRFVQNYFGDYLQCLLETGELPRLGSDDVPETECDDAYQSFSITEGRPAVSTNPYSDGSGSSDSINNPSNNNSDVTENDSDNPVASSGASGADGAAAQFRNTLTGRPSRVPTTSADAASGMNTDTLSGRNNFASNDTDLRGEAGRTAYIPIGQTSLIASQQDEKQGVVAVGSTETDGSTGRTQPKIIPIAEKKDREIQSDMEVSMGFGDYLRYLVIGVIILAIIIVVGGQLLQFQKSRE